MVYNLQYYWPQSEEPFNMQITTHQNHHTIDDLKLVVLFKAKIKETCFNFGPFDGSFDFTPCWNEINPQWTLVQVSPCQVFSLTQHV